MAIEIQMIISLRLILILVFILIAKCKDELIDQLKLLEWLDSDQKLNEKLVNEISVGFNLY